MNLFRSNGLAGSMMLVVVLAFASTAPAQSSGRAAGHVAPTPDGFTKFLVYMAEPMLTPGEPTSFHDPDNVNLFHRTIMGRSQAEMEQDRANAEQFFLVRFGLDFTAPQSDVTDEESSNGATLRGAFLNPNVDYRAYVISGEAVPSEGWVVRDGGWWVTLDEDMTLHGTYGGAEGKSVPAGALIVWGDYNIKAERATRKAPPRGDATIVIHYQSDSPVVGNDDDVMPFICDLTHPEWGPGKVRGVIFPASEFVIRNVLTFPPDLQ